MGARVLHLAILAILVALVLPGCDDSNNGVPVVVVTGQPMVVTGTTAQYAAATTNGNDTGYVWSTSDPTVASINSATGLLTAHISGTVDVMATGNMTGRTGMLTIACSEIPTDVVPFYAEWANSPHNDDTAEAFHHWDGDGEIQESCARCHSTPGFRDYLGDDGSPPGVVDQPAEIGTTIQCIACHNDASLAYSEVVFPSGAIIDGLGREATCMTCHQGRESSVSVDDVIDGAAPANDDTIISGQGFINVHYFPAAATRFGSQPGTNGIRVDGGYAYDDPTDTTPPIDKKLYDVYFQHVPGLDRCQDCHDQHTLEIRLDVCAGCHSVTTHDDLYRIRMESSKTNDYDGDGDLVEGIWWEIQGLRDMLLDAIQEYAIEHPSLDPIMYDEHTYPYWFKDNGLGANYANRYTTYTSRLLKATYNFQFATKDPGGFAHNAKFVIQLMYDSIVDLNAYPLTTPVDLSTAVRNDHGHFDGTAEAFRHWDEDGEVSSSCARCHGASAGFAEYLTYGSNTPKPVANGFDCAVCHVAFDTFETRRILSVTFPGGRSISVSGSLPTDDPAVESNICITCHQGREAKATIDAAIAVWLAAGKPAYPATGNLGFKNVHYLAAAADVFGTEAQVAYEYTRDYGPYNLDMWEPDTSYSVDDLVVNDGRTYRCVTAGTSSVNIGAGPKGPGLVIADGTVEWSTWYSNKFTHAAPGSNTNNCVFCHSPKNTVHTFLPNDNIALCKICHAGLTDDVDAIRLNRPFDYDGDGDNTELLEEEIEGLQALLYEALRDYARSIGHPIAYSGSRYPYFFNDPNDNGVVDSGETTYRSWDEKLLPAAHNYQQTQKEPAGWAHSIDYVAQCCYDSIVDLGGVAPASGRAPVMY